MKEERVREMKDSGIPWIGEIPKHWEIERIKTIFKERTELSENGEEELLSVSEYYGVDKRTNRIEDDEFISRSESLKGYKICYKGDFVSNIMLAWKGSLGVSKYHGIVSPAYCVYKPSETIYSPFYHYLFRTSLYTNRFKSFSKGIIDSRLRLYSPYFYDIEAIIPSFEEQEAIAEFLDRKCGEIDELVVLQDKMIEELKAYKQSIITETVTKGLNPNIPFKDSGIEWIGEIPQHWKNIRLKEGFRLRTGTTPKDFEKGLDSDSLINWFTPSDIDEMNCELNKSERHLSKNVINKEGISLNPIGTLIFVGIGASAGKIGYSLIESYSNQQITNLIPNEDKIVGKYVYYFLLADRKRIKDNAFFTTLPIINNSYLSCINILTPPLPEQQEIADFLDKKCSEIDSLIELKQQKKDTLKDYKKSIIYEYVTGKKQIS